MVSNKLFGLGLQTPQECPQVVSNMVSACLSSDPSQRPTAQEIIQVIESTMPANPNPFQV